jgi:hypothetical protein
MTDPPYPNTMGANNCSSSPNVSQSATSYPWFRQLDSVCQSLFEMPDWAVSSLCLTIRRAGSDEAELATFLAISTRLSEEFGFASTVEITPRWFSVQFKR